MTEQKQKSPDEISNKAGITDAQIGSVELSEEEAVDTK